MSSSASDLAQRLARDAEAVCRHYLSNGRREGRYWLIGDVHNRPGRSLFVRLKGAESGAGAAGKWTDAATGEHGDLLDLIRLRCGLTSFRDLADEARRFLVLPPPAPKPQARARTAAAWPGAQRVGRRRAAQRLFAMSQPICGTLAETYLHRRGIMVLADVESLRFHPRCYYRPGEQQPTQTWPAMIAAVTDLGGNITGAHRTWLDPSGADKAPVETPRRAMGTLLGNAVRFGAAGEVMAAGEGVETMLSVKLALQTMPMMAALSSAHLAAILFPHPLRRLYIARDRDAAGDHATRILAQRADDAGLETIVLSPRLGDFNEDLTRLGNPPLIAALRDQLAPKDIPRFLLHGA